MSDAQPERLEERMELLVTGVLEGGGGGVGRGENRGRRRDGGWGCRGGSRLNCRGRWSCGALV